jgi:hypothetical protein
MRQTADASSYTPRRARNDPRNVCPQRTHADLYSLYTFTWSSPSLNQYTLLAPKVNRKTGQPKPDPMFTGTTRDTDVYDKLTGRGAKVKPKRAAQC